MGDQVRVVVAEQQRPEPAEKVAHRNFGTIRTFREHGVAGGPYVFHIKTDLARRPVQDAIYQFVDFGRHGHPFSLGLKFIIQYRDNRPLTE
ncbi:hypothetical protein GCM10027436_43790 [Actinophytocola sediminis]